MPETCDNCGAVIGKLETPQLFQGHIVCVACLAKLRPTPAAKPNQTTVLTEQTSKKWKLLKLGGGLLMAVGGIMAVLGAAMSRHSDVSVVMVAGCCIMAIGFLVIVSASTMAWWHHG